MQRFKCQHENAPDAKFCNQCGLSLMTTPLIPHPVQSAQEDADSVSRLYVVLPFVISLLQLERRVTYRMLKDAFRLKESLLAEVSDHLSFRQLAQDVDGKGLVWTGELSASMARTTTGTSSQPDTTETLAVSLAAPPAPALATSTAPDTNRSAAVQEGASTSASSDESVVRPEPARSAPDAERRQLTVMFCDLVGSTDLSGKLDPEDLREVVRAYQETAAEVIQHYEGHIAQYLGDGLLIYFGFPVAHEDDAQRAVYTGLEIPGAIATLNRRLKADYGVQLAVRIGIHTGPVVVGEMGGGGRHENLALGETPNIAARLEGLAQANMAVISPVTAQLVQRSFMLEALGPHALKGVAEPMMLYTVVGPHEPEHDDHETMLSGGFEALVGRDEEIGLLLRRWEQSKEGQGQVVLISGEAGLGKSSLVEGLRAHVRQAGYTRIAFRCSPYTANSALHPVIAHVQHVLDWQRADAAETRLAKLEQSLAGYQFPSEASLPLLASLLALPLPEDRYPALTLTPQQQRQQINDMLVAWMLEEAERQPMLAVWEDLHWADPSTLELLGQLIEEVPTVSMMNVLAYRPVFTLPWQMQAHFTPLVLNRLERAHSEALVARLAGGKKLPDDVVQHIVSKTDGVPLYVEELTKMLLESELLQEEAEQYVLTGSLSEATIPATLQDSLMARLDRLPMVKEVAQLGAVLGREFVYEMLQALTVLEEGTLQQGLKQLVDHALLYQRGRLPRAKYIFRHALIRDAAYQSLLRRTRQHYHQEVAQLLEARFPEVVETQPELVAHHYTEAGVMASAVPYWQRAGQRAIERSANAEAIAHLRQGLAGLMTLPETPERLQQELDLQAPLSQALRHTKGRAHPEVKQVYDRALELCQLIGDSPQLVLILRGLMLYYRLQGLLQTARQLGEQLLRLAQAQSDPEPLIRAHFLLGQNIYFQGELTQAQAYHDEALTIYHAQEDPTLGLRYGVQLGVASQFWLARELWCLGYPDRALRHVREALALAHTVSHPYTSSWALYRAAMEHQYRRDASVAQAYATDAKRLASEHGFAEWLAMASAIHGWALAMQGQREQGIAELRQGFADALSTENRAWQPYLLSRLAEAYGESGHAEKGLPPLAEAMDLIDTLGLRVYGAELHRLKGELLLKQAAPNISEAETCFHDALELARAQQAKAWELRAATSLARLWQSQDKPQDAHELLAPVYKWFTEGFDTADLIEAKQLLDELSIEIASPTA